MHITKKKKPIWKGYLLYDSNHMTFWIWQNYENSEKSSGCQGLEVDGTKNSQNTENFQGNESTLYDTVMIDTCH